MMTEDQSPSADAKEYVTTITVEYDGNSFTTQEIAKLQSHLSQVATTRVRRHQGPAAGGPAIWAVIEFVGQSAADTIIGGAVWETLKLFSQKLVERYSKKHRMPTYDSIVIKFDDLDITVGLTKPETTARLPEIIADIRDKLSKPPLSRGSVNSIALPVEYTNGQWLTTSINWSGRIPDYPFRYWQVQSWDASGVWGIFDTERGVLLDAYKAPDEQLLEHLIKQPVDEAAYDPANNPESIQGIIQKLRPHLDRNGVGMFSGRVMNLAYGLDIDLYSHGPMREEDVKSLLMVCEWADGLSLESGTDVLAELSKFVQSHK